MRACSGAAIGAFTLVAGCASAPPNPRPTASPEAKPIVRHALDPWQDHAAKTQRWATTSTQYFPSVDRCSNGPFVVHMPRVSSRWGRRIAIFSFARSARGYFALRVYVDGRNLLWRAQMDSHLDRSEFCQPAVPPPSAPANLTTATPEKPARP